MTRPRATHLLAILALLAMATASVPLGAASALQPPAHTVPDGFEPMTDIPPEEQLPAAPLVVAAYAFIWVAVLAYVGLLWRRLGAVQKDLDALRRPPR